MHSRPPSRVLSFVFSCCVLLLLPFEQPLRSTLVVEGFSLVDSSRRTSRPRRIRRTQCQAVASGPSTKDGTNNSNNSNNNRRRSNHGLQKRYNNNNNPMPLSPRYYAVLALMPPRKQQRQPPSSSSSSVFAVDRLEQSFQTMSSNNGKNSNTVALTTRDRSFCRLLVTTCERRLGQIDAVLESRQRHKQRQPSSSWQPPNRMSRVDQYVQAVLRIGLAQLLFLDTPPYAAVKETIDTLRMADSPQSTLGLHVPKAKIGYANAVLRSVVELRTNNDNTTTNTTTTTTTGNHHHHTHSVLAAANATSATCNVAPWLVDAWLSQWGNDPTQAIVEAAMTETPRTLTVHTRAAERLRDEASADNTMDKDAATTNATTTTGSAIDFVASLFDNAEILPQGSIRIPNPPPGPISTWPLYREGAWWCQDASATVPAMALYNALSQRRVKNRRPWQVLDLCAAPGGKTAQLCNFGSTTDNDNNNTTANNTSTKLHVTAVEISARRARRLQQNRDRLGMDWTTVVADACVWRPTTGTTTEDGNEADSGHTLLADAVLCDVPCTATGTASKRPDVLRRNDDLDELLHVQQELARHAVQLIHVDGVLVYATCSLLKQESEDQVTKLLQLKNRDGETQLKMLPLVPGEIPGFDAAIDENGCMRILPGALPGSLGQCDGFFVARLQRIA